jgi:hypothetical protein
MLLSGFACRAIGRIRVTHKVDIVDYSVSGKCGGGRDSGGKEGGREEGKEKMEERIEEKRRKNWGRERKMGQERAKQIDIWTEWKRKVGNNRL